MRPLTHRDASLGLDLDARARLEDCFGASASTAAVVGLLFEASSSRNGDEPRSLRRRRAGAGTGGWVRDAERRGLVWAGARAGPAAETLGARGSLTASEEEDSAQTR